MHTTKLRKVGGSIMLAVPPAILDLLQLEVGAILGLAVDGERLIVDPKVKPRYTLAGLLDASDYSKPQPAKERQWTQPMGMNSGAGVPFWSFRRRHSTKPPNCL
jgi:antitoxin ChpS